MPGDRPFLTTVPGILTGIASVIVAITGLYIALHPGPKPSPITSSPGTEASTTTKASGLPEWPLVAEETFTNERSGWDVGTFSSDEAPRLDRRVIDGKYRWDVDFKGSQHGMAIAPYGSAVNFSVAVDARFTDVSILRTTR